MKININKTEELDSAITATVGKAHTHVHSAWQAATHVAVLHDKLCRYLPKKLLVGTIFRLNSKPSLPKAYGTRKVIHTEIDVEVFASGLFVTKISRCESWASSSKTGALAVAILPEPVKNHLKDVLFASAVRI